MHSDEHLHAFHTASSHVCLAKCERCPPYRWKEPWASTSSFHKGSDSLNGHAHYSVWSHAKLWMFFGWSRRSGPALSLLGTGGFKTACLSRKKKKSDCSKSLVYCCNKRDHYPTVIFHDTNVWKAVYTQLPLNHSGMPFSQQPPQTNWAYNEKCICYSAKQKRERVPLQEGEKRLSCIQINTVEQKIIALN